MHMEETHTIPVTFTAGALAELKKLMATEANDQHRYLRIGVKGGGCSGLSYVLALDERSDKDELFEVDGIPCIMNPAHALYLHGMEIDWKQGLEARGFNFTNPNASSTCGCGSSFAV
jgi:iron-sulfur cluster assembly protein